MLAFVVRVHFLEDHPSMRRNGGDAAGLRPLAVSGGGSRNSNQQDSAVWSLVSLRLSH
jgi:hypothetical protein